MIFLSTSSKKMNTKIQEQVITHFLFYSVQNKFNTVFMLYALSIFPNVSSILLHTLNNKSTHIFTAFILIQEFKKEKRVLTDCQYLYRIIFIVDVWCVLSAEAKVVVGVKKLSELFFYRIYNGMTHVVYIHTRRLSLIHRPMARPLFIKIPVLYTK